MLSKANLLRLIMVITAFAADQYTKWLARKHFSFAGGEPDYWKVEPILGEWLRFRLVFNEGAAFGLSPQSLFPFLHPSLFFGLVTLIAVIALGIYYFRLPAWEGTTRTGIALILAGAFGNFADRMALHKVTDFIDAGVPGFNPRWPTFNLADAYVCVGVALILILPLFRSPGRGEGEVTSNPVA